jgi:sigma-B regulation protein RsbU (phosphoserine phosphatase)
VPSTATTIDVDSLLLEVADAVNTTLDLDTLLHRVAELVRRVINYEVFAILLLNEKTQELRIRFSIGHSPEIVESSRIKVGEGVTGRAVQQGRALLVNDVTQDSDYIVGMPGIRSELAVPLIAKNRVIGVIDIEARQPGYFSKQHEMLLTVVASRIAQGIENARLYTRTARQAKTLAVLNDISRELSSILNVDELLKRIGDLLKRLIDYQMFSILLLDATGTKLEHRFSLRFNENVQVKQDLCTGEGLCGFSALHREPVLVADVSRDPRYVPLNQETRSELVVPLIYQDKVIGVLDLEHTRRGYFTEDHVRTLTTLAAQVAIALENARLYQAVEEQEKRLAHDLELARELQFRLLPPCCPRLGKAELSARFVPARQIGGDLYDFITYSGDGPRTGIALGDICGKGAPAAIYASLVSGVLRSHAAEQPDACDMLRKVNASLCARPIPGQYASMIYAIWDEQQRRLSISNSGLPQPIYCREGSVELVQSTGLPLGLFDTADYDELAFQPQAGELFVFFSDGILDAASATGEAFGRERLEEVVARHCGTSANHLVEAIFTAVAKHSAAVETFDDQTVVVLKIN